MPDIQDEVNQEMCDYTKQWGLRVDRDERHRRSRSCYNRGVGAHMEEGQYLLSFEVAVCVNNGASIGKWLLLMLNGGCMKSTKVMIALLKYSSWELRPWGSPPGNYQFILGIQAIEKHQQAKYHSTTLVSIIPVLTTT